MLLFHILPKDGELTFDDVLRIFSLRAEETGGPSDFSRVYTEPISYILNIVDEAAPKMVSTEDVVVVGPIDLGSLVDAGPPHKQQARTTLLAKRWKAFSR